MMKSEVTQGLYTKLVGKNPSKFKKKCGENCPVEKVSWYDAVQFANMLSHQEGRTPCYVIVDKKAVSWSAGLACTGWRLPSEAEWEYAARGGQSTKYAGSNDVDSVAWYKSNSEKRTHPVCGKKKNGYGLCDMSGNVKEWVWNFYYEYSSLSQTDPLGPSSGSSRTFRDGSWDDRDGGERHGYPMHVPYRNGWPPSIRSTTLGFRLVRTAQ